MQPPVIPFMPLLLKDMTFAHEGNKTSLDGLVNFEKMHMMAQTMRTIRFCRSRHLGERISIFIFMYIVQAYATYIYRGFLDKFVNFVKNNNTVIVWNLCRAERGVIFG